jgi:DNA-binding NarL/FixJ family response regulator
VTRDEEGPTIARMMKNAASGSGTGGSVSDPITILIVDDERTFGEALEVALDREEDLQILEVATDGADAIRLVRERQPDVVIMDVSMPGMNGIEATRRILETKPDTAVLVLSGHEDEHLLARAVQAGAAGLLRKTEAVEDVADSIRKAHQGEPLHDDDDLERAMRRLRHRRDADDDARRRLDRLTPRETEILELMARGMTPEEIATSLKMSPNTLRTHTQNVLTKLGVHSKMEALVLAIRHGKVATIDLTESD